MSLCSLGVARSAAGHSAGPTDPSPNTVSAVPAAAVNAERDRLLAMAREFTLSMLSGDDPDEAFDRIMP